MGDMRVPTFYSTENKAYKIAPFFCMPVVGVVFGGIHCMGWFFDFPSNVEAMLWRVSSESAVLTGIAFLFPIFLISMDLYFLKIFNGFCESLQRFIVVVFSIIVQVYVVSRLILLVEAFISLRQLTPGMLALLLSYLTFNPILLLVCRISSN
jgi:hypothetical protein